MKKILTLLLVLSGFFSGNLHAAAGDTIAYWALPAFPFEITATLGKQFNVRYYASTVYETFTGTGESQLIDFAPSGLYDIIIEGEEDCAFTSFSSDALVVPLVDLSKCPSIKYLTINHGVLNINLSNCINLEKLSLGVASNHPTLIDLDLSDCRALKEIYCHGQKLSVLDINLNNNPAIQFISCPENHLPLSNLYALSELIEDSNNKKFARQTLSSQRVLLGDAIDYSSQKEFGGVATNFWVLNGQQPNGYVDSLADPNEYTVDNGMITFHKEGWYTVDMRNSAIIQNPEAEPARVLVYVQVIDFVPVTGITNIPATITVGREINLAMREVLPANATYTDTDWRIHFSSSPNCFTLSGTILRARAEGFLLLRATIREGLAFGEDFEQYFVINLIPLSIDEPAQALSAIELYPNPTTGELNVGIAGLLNSIQYRNDVRNIEVFDVYGRNVLSHKSLLSPETTLNISHLPAGTYFVKIITEQGVIVKKVVKQ